MQDLIDIPGIGDKTAQSLEKAGITSIDELLHTYPRTYRTYSHATTRSANVGDWVLIQGTISKPSSHHTGRISTQTAKLKDLDGTLTLRWFNMPYIARSINPQSRYRVMGKLESFRGVKQIVSPQLKLLKPNDQDLTHNITVPIYRQKGTIKPWIFRTKIESILEHIDPIQDNLNKSLRDKYQLIDLWSAIENIHRPHDMDTLEQAIHRLSFQELLELQLQAISDKKEKAKKAIPLKISDNITQELNEMFPFTLTPSQENAIQEILGDLRKDTAMHRLLQGEVGSGKTAVAASLAKAVHSSGHRTIIMAPTQILATQLATSLSKYLTKNGITLSLITGSKKGDDKSDVIVGTQAILTKNTYPKVGLVIIDEQHRFGVEQREKLVGGKIAPHMLMMTATPIPRSLAMTLFGHLDITRLIGTPPGRLETKTFYIDEQKRLDSYTWIKQEIKNNGNQVFFVTPLIEIAEEGDTTPLKSVKELGSSLKSHFPGLAIEIMHGKMKNKDKDSIMQRFREGTIDILVATSMIEVGIDIPEANIMVIENAERFGLAQLHQLRGRVGRGGKQGYCLLFSDSKSDKARDRLSYFVRVHDGEKLAKYDLEHRGPGELFGITQHGFFNLAVGSMYDEKLLEETHEAALELAKSPVSP